MPINEKEEMFSNTQKINGIEEDREDGNDDGLQKCNFMVAARSQKRDCLFLWT